MYFHYVERTKIEKEIKVEDNESEENKVKNESRKLQRKFKKSNMQGIMEKEKKIKLSNSDDEMEMYIKEHTMCVICGGTPCDWDNFKDIILSRTMGLNAEHGIPNNLIRKEAYKIFVMEKYGYLGENNRIKIASCVTDQIRNIFPNDDNSKYMGFKSE